MCGRYVLKTTLQELQQKYGAVPEGTFTIEENYNVAPSLHMPVIVQQGHQRKIDKYRWGLIPFWAKEINSGYSMINARAESLEQKKSYARPFKSKRCV
ncbi:MAG TPA: SOS response-associated peptidase family protein, partial [Halalkalibaculum sp.]|nr:SOS response-associated peptidase family protein [Halalkalibaculum sp.]